MRDYILNESDEVIEKHYIDYLSNLREYSKHFECLWLHPDEIFTEVNIDDNGWYVCSDPFLKDTDKDRLALARDILENGTYWHIHVREENGLLHLRDGIHRIWSIKRLVEAGEWPSDKKLFCITRTPIKISKDVRVRLPVNVTLDFQLRYPKGYWGAGDLVGETSIEASTDSAHILAYIAMYPALLRDSIYRSGRIKPSTIINNEEEWYKFIKE